MKPLCLALLLGILTACVVAAQDDVADVPAQDRLVDKDKNKRYFLIGPAKGSKAPKAGFGLIVLLPGGPGGAEFHPFVKRIFKHAVPKGYVVAQPVAVKWSKEQAIVWPTATNKVEGMKFSTEHFIDAVIADVGKEHAIDPSRIFTLTWSSSGPAAYAASLTSKKITGSFVAMSVFKPEELPALEKSKGHAYYIYHSREDRICPFRMAEQAERDLKKAGAEVTLVEYAGGHGWRGPLYDNIREGLRWLDKNRARPQKGDPSAFAGSKAGEEREIEGVKLCWCPPGRFTMGSPATETDRLAQEDQVEVTLTKGYWVGKFEVTQGDWKRLVGKLPGKLTAGEGDDYPLYNVNYPEAESFCRKLTEKARASGTLPKDWEFRLPTEAQWEYACRAGTTTATAFGDKLSSKQANFSGKPYNGAEKGPSLGRTARVGSYPANAWGLHDVHGNVYEWCRDWFHHKLPGGTDPDLSTVEGPKNRDGSASRVRRSGSWSGEGGACRSALRLRFEPERRYDQIGFRVVAVGP